MKSIYFDATAEAETLLLQQLRDKYHFDALRAENVLSAAKKRL